MLVGNGQTILIFWNAKHIPFRFVARRGPPGSDRLKSGRLWFPKNWAEVSD